MLFQDLIQIYKVFYILVAEILERFAELTVDNAKRAFVVYQNFVNLTTVMKAKADIIMSEFDFSIKLPNFYSVDSSLIQTLRQCIEQKQNNPKGLENISK